MTTFAVTVTYENRFHLLKQVIDSALDEGVTKVIVVDNNSVFESKEQLKAYEQELGKDKIKVLYLDDNYGSASGFKRGLEEAYNDPKCEFIWLLDDDNEPEKGSLKVLKSFWNDLNQEDKNEKVSLLSYRKNRQDQQNAIKNGYMIKYDKVKLLKIKFGIKKKKEFIECDVAPYGGLFFNKIIINTVGLPNEDFFVYADDHEWTSRFFRNNVSIYLVQNSTINDIDLVWQANDKNISDYDVSSEKLYYTFRNHTYLRCHIFKYPLYKSYITIKFNIIVLLNFFHITSRKIDIIQRAINDGLNKKIGKINK